MSLKEASRRTKAHFAQNVIEEQRNNIEIYARALYARLAANHFEVRYKSQCIKDTSDLIMDLSTFQQEQQWLFTKRSWCCKQRVEMQEIDALMRILKGLNAEPFKPENVQCEAIRLADMVQ